jgi:hypothetical protein
LEHLEKLEAFIELDALYLTGNQIDDYSELENLKSNTKLTTISLFGNGIYKNPGYKMRLV